MPRSRKDRYLGFTGKREAQEVTQALFALVDARDAVEHDRRDALSALDDVQAALSSVEHSPGVTVARAARKLRVSDPTVRTWIERGALREIPGITPTQVDPESLRRVVRVVAELRERGQNREWLQALADYLDDRAMRRSDALREGPEISTPGSSNSRDGVRGRAYHDGRIAIVAIDPYGADHTPPMALTNLRGRGPRQ